MSQNIVKLLQRAMNCNEFRPADHNSRVANLVSGMLRVLGCNTAQEIRELRLLALLHNIGSYEAREGERISSEADGVSPHALYSSLLLREFSPLSGWSNIILYHHTPWNRMAHLDPNLALLAQVFQVADRVESLYRMNHSREQVERKLRADSRYLLSPEAVQSYFKAVSLEEKQQEFCSTDSIPVSNKDAEQYIRLLCNTVDFRNSDTVAHSHAVAAISEGIAKTIGCAESELLAIRRGAMLHDLGKIGIPRNNPDGTSEADMHIAMRHIVIVREILTGCIDPCVVEIVCRHHEHLDGSGYPQKLSGQELHMRERIVAVANRAAILLSKNYYRKSYPIGQVLTLLFADANQGRLDKSAVEAFADHCAAIVEETERICLPVYNSYNAIKEDFEDLYLRMAVKSCVSTPSHKKGTSWPHDET